MTGAAFFDLDRTLLAGSSGEMFSDALRTAGITTRSVPGERWLYRLFNTIGETLPSMLLARQAVLLAKGRPAADVAAAARDVAPRLAEQVQPFAAPLIAEHRAAGRPVVLATTTPYGLVAPLAALLQLDDVIATRYTTDDEGRYDGTLDGPFVWSAGKLRAVADWASTHEVELAASYAYSDSVYDTPLLDAVGHPVVVNPDPRMVLTAAARRWPTIELDAPPGVRRVPVVGLEAQELLMRVAQPAAFPYARFAISGLEQLPDEGPAILCANHRSYFDVAALAVAFARHGRPVRFLGKKEVFDAPIIGPVAAAMGGIRVDRASGSEAPLAAAAEALRGGELVALMPQGTIPRGPAFFQKPKGRWGAAKLAGETGAPVIPIGLWGTEQVWPRSRRLPDMLNVTDPPTVEVSVGPPVRVVGRSADADTRRIMDAIVALLPDEARRRRRPTAEELALTYPPSYRSDPDAESLRRPGTD
ncbi:MAG: HAD-IB family hydrolase [Actinomycetota bacterium]